MSGRFILDTNVVGYMVNTRMPETVRQWFDAQGIGNFYLTAITIGELVQGIAKLDKDDPRKKIYTRNFQKMFEAFDRRILPYDTEDAVIWGEIRGNFLRQGRTVPELDMQIAAIAKRHGMALATVNVRHFIGLGVDVINPLAV